MQKTIFKKELVKNLLEKIKGQKKVPKGNYFLFGKFPIVDQGAGFINGYINDETFIYKGPLPVIVFGDHTCRLKFLKNDFCLGADGTQLMYTKKINQTYFYYALKNLNFKISAYQRHYKLIKEKSILFPDSKDDQHRIASILSSYDDLIENNEKRIKILEEMAQLLYTEWFVKFKFSGHEKVKLVNSGTEFGMIPEGWEIKKLGNIINVSKGKNITKSTIVDGDVPVVAGGLNPAYYHDTPNTSAPVVTVSASGANSGFVNLYQIDIWASDCSYIDREIIPYVYYYYLFLKNNQTNITNMQRGSAQPHVYPKDLMQLSIVDIPDNLLKEFELKAGLMFEKIGNLKKQNIKLSNIRDLLIPQLVTGKRELK